MADQLELRYIPLDEAITQLWDRNPKAHDLGALCRSIEQHGFKEAPRFEPTLNQGRGGIVAGNGRIEALTAMHAEGRPLPRGIAEHDGAWFVPVLFGVDATSQSAAEAYGVDANNLTMMGGTYTAVDMARMWEPASYLSLLSDLAAQDALPVTVDGDDVDTLLSVLTGERAEVTGRESEPTVAPDEFKSYDEDIETEHCCPKCGYTWSGKAK